MKNVLLRAPLLTNSGYGVHSRQIFEWLMSRKDLNVTTQTLQWGATPWIVNSDADDGIYRDIMKRSSNIDKKFDITFQVQLPDEWDTSLGRFNVGVTALVETDRCNSAWMQKLIDINLIIVPSRFTKGVILKTFGSSFDRKVKVIPEWFNPHLVSDETTLSRVRDERYYFDTNFNLMTIGTLTSPVANCDRKNLVNTIGWAIEALEGEANTGIIVKTCLGKGSVADREMTKSAVAQIVSMFRKSHFPRVHLIHGNMTSLEVASLFRSGRVQGYISATRGEGYGLPLIEAAASGIPIIATGWSGHLDFLKDSFLKVDYDLVNIPNEKIDNRIFIQGTRWAEPKKDSYIENIRYLIENYKKQTAISKKLKKNITHLYSREKIFKKYNEFIKENFDL